MDNPICADTITHHIAAIVLNYFRSGEGYPPSTGEYKLIDAIASVDFDLQTALEPGFPGLVDAVRSAQGDVDGLRELKLIVSGA